MWLASKLTTIFSKGVAYSHILSQLWYFCFLLVRSVDFPTLSCNWFRMFNIISCKISVCIYYGDKRNAFFKPQYFTFLIWKSFTLNWSHKFWILFSMILAHSSETNDHVKKCGSWITSCKMMIISHKTSHFLKRKICLVALGTYHIGPSFSLSKHP